MLLLGPDTLAVDAAEGIHKIVVLKQFLARLLVETEEWVQCHQLDEVSRGLFQLYNLLHLLRLWREVALVVLVTVVPEMGELWPEVNQKSWGLIPLWRPPLTVSESTGTRLQEQKGGDKIPERKCQIWSSGWRKKLLPLLCILLTFSLLSSTNWCIVQREGCRGGLFCPRWWVGESAPCCTSAEALCEGL